MQTVGLTIAYYHCIPHLDNILHLDIYNFFVPSQLTSHIRAEHNMFFHVKISLTLLLYIKITDESSHSQRRIKNTIETVKIGNIISTMMVSWWCWWLNQMRGEDLGIFPIMTNYG